MPRATVIYHYESEGWWAESPEYPDYGAAGGSLAEVIALVREGLPWHAGEPLEIVNLRSEASAGVLTTVCSPTTTAAVSQAIFYGQGITALSKEGLMAKPKPVTKNTVCSECGLPWEKHNQGQTTEPALPIAPTLEECVRLLKAELARKSAFLGHVTSGVGTNVPQVRWGS